jgi:hypothetical protein
MRAVVFLAALTLAGCAHQEAAQTKTKAVAIVPDAKSAIVAASIYGHWVNGNGECPCPYSRDGACRGKSDWDIPGGANPRCYRSDVTAADMKRWRDLLKRPAPEREK